MKKQRKIQANKRLRWQRCWAALLIALILLGGGAALWQAAEIMAAETRCGQVFASVTPQNGVLDFTILGWEGQLPYVRWGHELAKDFTALPAPGRLLLWGCGALWELWQQKILPFTKAFLC